MHARLARIRLQPHHVAEALHLVRDEVVPHLLVQPGVVKGSWSVGRSGGEILAVTCWDDLESLGEATSRMGRVRAGVLDRVGGTLVDTEVLTVHGLAHDALTVGGEHLHSRITWVEGLPGDVEADAESLFQTSLARKQGAPGFAAVCWLSSASTGNGLGITSWRTRAALDADARASRRLRREVTRAFGCRVEAVATYESFVATVAPRTSPSPPDPRPRLSPVPA